MACHRLTVLWSRLLLSRGLAATGTARSLDESYKTLCALPAAENPHQHQRPGDPHNCSGPVEAAQTSYGICSRYNDPDDDQADTGRLLPQLPT